MRMLNELWQILRGRLKTQTGQRLVNGSLAQGYAQATTIFMQVITVPVLLHCWGVKLYGIWLTLSVVPTYLSLAELGFGQASANEMTMLLARHDTVEANCVFNSVLVLVLAVSCSVVVIALFAVWAIDISAIFPIDVVAAADAKTVLDFFAIYILFSLAYSVMNGAIRAEGRFATMSAQQTTARLLEGASIMVAGLCGYGIVAAACAVLVVRCGALVQNIIYIFRYCRFIRFDLRTAKWAEIKRLWYPSISYMGFPVGNALYMQGALSIIGLQSVGMVALFSTQRTLSHVGTSALSMLNGVFLYDYGHCAGKQNAGKSHGKFQKLFKLHSAITAIGLCAYLLLMVVAGQWIFMRWTGAHIKMDNMLFWVLMVLACLESVWGVLRTPLVASNHHIALARNYVLGCVATLPLAFWVLRASHNLSAMMCVYCLLFVLLAALAWREMRRAFFIIGTVSKTSVSGN